LYTVLPLIPGPVHTRCLVLFECLFLAVCFDINFALLRLVTSFSF
jgi:hypothetical protein